MMQRIDNYGEFKRSIVEPDFDAFMKDKGDLRKAWHCAGSLFHLHDWVYVAHKSSIDAEYTFFDDKRQIKFVSKASHFANSLGQKHPDFELIRGIANSSKHLELDPVPAGRVMPQGMPTSAANTYASGAVFQAGVFQANVFQTGSVKLQTNAGDIEFAVLAKSVLDMWNQLFTEENW